MPSHTPDGSLSRPNEVPLGSRASMGTMPRTVSEDSLVDVSEAERASGGSIPENETRPTSARKDRPSEETPSGSAGAVGALPGEYSEASVAKLPEERREEEAAAREISEKRRRETQGAPSQDYSEKSVAKLPQEALPSEKTITQERPTETGAVGSPPGSYPESGVAKLQDERSTEASPPNSADVEKHEKYVRTPGKGPLHGDPRGSRAFPEERTLPKAEEEAPPERGGSKTGGLQEEVKVMREKLTEKEREIQSKKSPEIAAQDSMSRPGEHKPGFMERMKGEAKILTGRLAGNDRKVEEGRNMAGR